MLFIKILNKLNLLNFFNLIGTIKLNDKTFKIPIINKIGLPNIYMSETWMIELLKKLDIKEGTFIDIGVNIGQTLLKLKSVNENLNYIGFEPNPTCTFYTNKLILHNNFKNTQIVPVGISNVDSLTKLNYFSHSPSDPSATTIDNFRPNKQIKFSQFIPLNSFETLSKTIDFNNIKIIKIDVEGAELEVLKSLSNFISKHQPIILIEILPVYNEKNKERLKRQEQIEAILKELNYSLYRIKIEENKFIELSLIEKIGIHSDLNQCDYIFKPKA